MCSDIYFVFYLFCLLFCFTVAFAPVSACVHFELEQPSCLEMVEETYEKLDLLLFNADQQTLHDFSGHCGIDTGPTDRINRR